MDEARHGRASPERPAFAPQALRRVRRSFSEGGSGTHGVPASDGAGGPARLRREAASARSRRSAFGAQADGAKPPGLG